jgi:hypothetical protein
MKSTKLEELRKVGVAGCTCYSSDCCVEPGVQVENRVIYLAMFHDIGSLIYQEPGGTNIPPLVLDIVSHFHKYNLFL